MSAIPMILMLATAPKVPESPHYLMSRGRTGDVERLLQRVAAFNGCELPAGRLVAEKGAGDEEAPVGGGGVGEKRPGGDRRHHFLVGATPGGATLVEEDGWWGREGERGESGRKSGWWGRLWEDVHEAMGVLKPPFRCGQGPSLRLDVRCSVARLVLAAVTVSTKWRGGLGLETLFWWETVGNLFGGHAGT